MSFPSRSATKKQHPLCYLKIIEKPRMNLPGIKRVIPRKKSEELAEIYDHTCCVLEASTGAYKRIRKKCLHWRASRKRRGTDVSLCASPGSYGLWRESRPRRAQRKCQAREFFSPKSRAVYLRDGGTGFFFHLRQGLKWYSRSWVTSRTFWWGVFFESCFIKCSGTLGTAILGWILYSWAGGHLVWNNELHNIYYAFKYLCWNTSSKKFHFIPKIRSS